MNVLQDLIKFCRCSHASVGAYVLAGEARLKQVRNYQIEAEEKIPGGCYDREWLPQGHQRRPPEGDLGATL
jgi:hypothetical protein